MNNDISFKGGFLIEKPSAKMWTAIQTALPRKKCVFQDFNENGDKFFAIKNVYDKNMAGLLLRMNVKFKFYPDINLKSRLDTYFPEEAHQIVNSQTNVINTRKQLINFLIEKSKVITPDILKYHWKPNDHIEKTLLATGLKPADCDVKIIKGITYIKDKYGKIIAKASPNNERGVNFVYVYPKNHDDSSKRFALSQAGEKEYFGPLQIIDFQNNFFRNVKIDLGRKRPQNKTNI